MDEFYITTCNDLAATSLGCWPVAAEVGSIWRETSLKELSTESDGFGFLLLGHLISINKNKIKQPSQVQRTLVNFGVYTETSSWIKSMESNGTALIRTTYHIPLMVDCLFAMLHDNIIADPKKEKLVYPHIEPIQTSQLSHRLSKSARLATS